MSKFTYLLLLLLFATGISYAQISNKKPMYGTGTKTEAQKQLDEQFIKTVVSQLGSKESASEVFVKKAWAYFYHDSLDIAIQRFNQAWLLNESNPDVYFGFGAILENRGEKAEAERFYKMGLAKDSTRTHSKTCLQHIANCREQIKDLKGAISSYQRMVSLSPDDDFPYEKIGSLHAQMGNHEMAIKAYNASLKLDPGDVVIFNNRGFEHYMLKNYPAAIADYTTAIGFDATYIEAYVNRGTAKMDSGDLAGAKKDFEAAAQLDPEAGVLWRMLGTAKVKLKDTAGACQDFEKAKKAGDPQAEELIKKHCK